MTNFTSIRIVVMFALLQLRMANFTGIRIVIMFALLQLRMANFTSIRIVVMFTLSRNLLALFTGGRVIPMRTRICRRLYLIIRRRWQHSQACQQAQRHQQGQKLSASFHVCSSLSSFFRALRRRGRVPFPLLLRSSFQLHSIPLPS